MRTRFRYFILAGGIITVILVGFFSLNGIYHNVNSNEVKSINETGVGNTHTVDLSPPPKPFSLPNPVLTDNEKQQLISIAMNQSGIKAWSNQWQFSTMDFKGEKTDAGLDWQEAIVFLYLSPSMPAPFKCDEGWTAKIGIDMTTNKVMDALYPTMQSHQCHGISSDINSK